ncbi:hypothetical protein L6452_40085 [Arctium lappa]|uniref:Uncharacterized protein n=1 Tax=Arctium lappa TaxID=4217 RepID=A0ACB8XQ28_ARCLA|nr:hypothetical protein L6452_40085 [Arctium lappa]
MDYPDLEDIPPDLREFFFENSKIKKSILELLSNSLGFNSGSPISNAIKKQVPPKISKKRGSITNDKVTTAVVDLVKSDLAIKIDRSETFVDSKKDMIIEDVINQSEVNMPSNSVVNYDLSRDSKISESSPADFSYVNKSANVLNKNSVNIKNVINLYEAISNNSLNRNANNFAGASTVQKPIGGSVKFDYGSIHVKPSIISVMNDSIDNESGLNMEGGWIGASGKGGHYFTFGNSSGANGNGVSDVNMEDKVESQSDAIKTNLPKQPSNAWNSKGVTLADKIKGKTDRCGEEMD